MTWDEFWNDDCEKVKYYREAHKLKIKQKNEEMWLQGMYVYEAIADLVPVLRFTFDKSPKPIPYPYEPYPIDGEDAQKKLIDAERRKADEAKQRLMKWANTVNKSIKGGGTK